jgi:hypothetical protein
MTNGRTLAERRAVLITQCELDRLEVALAYRDVRRALHLGGDGEPVARRNPWLGRLIGIVLPLIGATRAKRLSRYTSLALLAYRIFTGLRKGR